MKKTICDICKKDSGNDNFILPMWMDMRGGIGNYIIMPKVMIEIVKDIDLCPECASKIATFIYEMK